jgi:hypothetical protein
MRYLNFTYFSSSQLIARERDTSLIALQSEDNSFPEPKIKFSLAERKLEYVYEGCGNNIYVLHR